MRCEVFTICLLWVLPWSSSAQHDCKLKIDKNNIRIYNCPSAKSAFNDIQAEFEVSATIDAYISIVLDISNYKTWRYHETNHRILKKISDTELIYYNQVEAPFPVSNRDLISHLTIRHDTLTQGLVVTVESMPDYLPPVANVVRVPRSKSVMTLTPVNKSKLRAQCVIQVDPGGRLPAWVANTFSTQAPYETFRNLRTKMEAK